MTMLTQKVKELEYSKLRILDFYLCFPAEIAKIELPKQLQNIRMVAKVATKSPTAHREAETAKAHRG